MSRLLQFGEDQSLLLLLVEQAQESPEASWRVGFTPLAKGGDVSVVWLSGGATGQMGEA